MEPADLRDVARDQWVPFLSEFGKAHFGEPVVVRVVHRNGGPTASDTGPTTPLLSLADVTDAAGERIDVVTGTVRPVSHTVVHPIRVRVSDPQNAARPTVAIDDADGSTTLLRFLTDRPGQA